VKKSISILIPFEEKLNSYYGGAIARWVNEVHSRNNDFDVKVFGRICNDVNDYKSINIVSKYNFLFNIILKIPYLRRLLTWFYCLIYIKEIRACDVVEIHNSYNYISILKKLRYKGKIILHMHNDYLGYLEMNELKEISNNIDVLITCSDFLRERVKNKSKELYKKSFTVYNGFDEKQFYPYREKNCDELSLGYVGRIDYNKGLHILLDLYEVLLTKIPMLKLYVVGGSGFGISGSSYEKRCINKINLLRKEKKANIEYVGYLHNKDLVKYYNKFTLFCSFSLQNEAFGMTYIEAMACKTPVLANNIGGVKEAVFFEEMLIQDIDNMNEIEIKILDLLSNKKLYTTLSIGAYEYVSKNFRWQNIVNTQNEVLKKIL
jgi:glycosyltransferase involved in cell wall biosynthesis